MISEWLRKRKIKRQQAECPHKWTYVGETVVESYSGIEVDFDDAYIIYCPRCDLRKSYRSLRDAQIEVKILELRKGINV